LANTANARVVLQVQIPTEYLKYVHRMPPGQQRDMWSALQSRVIAQRASAIRTLLKAWSTKTIAVDLPADGLPSSADLWDLAQAAVNEYNEQGTGTYVTCSADPTDPQDPESMMVIYRDGERVVVYDYQAYVTDSGGSPSDPDPEPDPMMDLTSGMTTPPAARVFGRARIAVELSFPLPA
jgi:hypothetical protein